MHKHRSTIIWITCSVVIIGAAIALWVSYGPRKTSDLPKPKKIQTSQGSQTSKQSFSGTSTPTPSQGNSTPNTNSTNTQQVNFSAPSGTFVSNHKPNLSGIPAPNTEESTCIVQDGVTCNITFTNGGTSLSLGDQTAGSNGVVSWQWNLQGEGITQGSWIITATAELNGKTMSTQDPLTLDVSP